MRQLIRSIRQYQQRQQQPTHLEEQRQFGTAPANFPPEFNMPTLGPPCLVGNLLNQTGAVSSTTFLTLANQGVYLIGWMVQIVSTNAAGSLTFTVSVPGAPNIPGVQAAPATPANGQGPAAAYYCAAGAQITGAVTVSGLTGTTFNLYVYAIRLF